MRSARIEASCTYLSVTPWLCTTKMFGTSMPVGLPILSIRCLTTYRAFANTVSVIAICAATKVGPARLRSRAEIIGRTFKIIVIHILVARVDTANRVIPDLLALEVHGRRNAPYAPGRIHAGHQSRHNGEHGRPDETRQVHVRERLVSSGAQIRVCVKRAHSVEKESTQPEAKQRAG